MPEVFRIPCQISAIGPSRRRDVRQERGEVRAVTEGPDRLEPEEREQTSAGAPLPHPGDPAPDVAFRDETGADVRLSDLWSRAPRGLALVFVRHLGCPFCRAHVAALRDAEARFREEGVRIAVVGMGTPEQCARFQRRQGLNFPVLSDPDRVAHRSYGLPEGTTEQVMGRPEIAAGLRLALRGLLPSRPVGNPRQLAGDFLIDREGVLRYARRANRAADIPDPEALLAAAHDLL